ncbi:MAG: hypothetical protein ACI4IF_01455 [Acutalibacteraceae bacterium]
MKKTSKKIICLLLALLIIVSSVSVSAAAASPGYPQGVTATEAVNAVNGLDKLIKNVVPSLTGKTLSASVKPVIYNSDTLSSMLLSVYMSFEDDGSELKSLGIETSPDAVAEGLYAYPDVQKRLQGKGSWAEVDLTGAKWGVTEKNGFATAIGRMFTPFSDILYMLLCSGTFTFSKIIKIKGDNGYENAVVPMLQSLKCNGIISQANFTAEADNDKSTMVKNIVLPILNLLEKVLNSPMNTLTNSLPSFAYFMESGEMDACMDKLTEPITTNKLVEIAVFLKILDLESFNIDFEAMLNDGVSELTAENGFKLKEIDFKALSQCGKEENGVFNSNKGLACVEILGWFIDTLKLNKDTLPKLLQSMGNGNSQTDLSVLTDMLSGETDSIVSTIILLFTPSKNNSPKTYVYPALTGTTVKYASGLTEDNYKKVLNEIDGLLDDFVKEGGSYKTIESLLKCNVYTGANVTSLIAGIYGAVEKEGLTETVSLLGIDVTPKGVAAELQKRGYTAAAGTLKSKKSWNDVKTLSWGFYNGSRNGFQNALTASLSPLLPLLRVVLCEEDIVLFDSITIKGADGYNTSIIPLLESLGCKSSSIKTYSQYKKHSNTDDALDYIIDPVLDLLDDVFETPVKTLSEKLPNIVYFMNSGSLEICLDNLLIPITSLASKLDGIVDVNLDTSKITKSLDVNSLTSSLLGSTNMKIAEFDIKEVAGLGTLTTRNSKSTFNTKYSYVEADSVDVVAYLLNVLAKTILMPGNENLLTSLMGADSGSFSMYASSMGDMFNGMTEDDLIGFLYNLLFKERVQIEIQMDDDYSPTIIYKEPAKNYTPYYIIGGFLVFALAVGAVLFINRKKLYC